MRNILGGPIIPILLLIGLPTLAYCDSQDADSNFKELSEIGITVQQEMAAIAESIRSDESTAWPEHQEVQGKEEGHPHYFRHMTYPYTNPYNAPNPPASIDVTRGPLCACTDNQEEKCKENEKKVTDPDTKKFGLLKQIAIDTFCKTNNITPCPTTPQELYGGGPFKCEKIKETIDPSLCW